MNRIVFLILGIGMLASCSTSNKSVFDFESGRALDGKGGIYRLYMSSNKDTLLSSTGVEYCQVKNGEFDCEDLRIIVDVEIEDEG